MTNIRIKELPVVEERQSTYTLGEMIKKLSALNSDEFHIYSDFGEALLCLAQEIQDIKRYNEIMYGVVANGAKVTDFKGLHDLAKKVCPI